MSYLSSFCLLYLQSGNVSEKAVFKGLRTCISNAILHFKCYFAIGSLGSLGLVHSILDVGSRFKSSSIGLIHSVYIIQYSFKAVIHEVDCDWLLFYCTCLYTSSSVHFPACFGIYKENFITFNHYSTDSPHGMSSSDLQHSD